MGRGSESASTAATSAQNLSNTYAGNTAGLFSSLTPMLMSQAVAPAGMSPTDMAMTDTASQQSAGGAQGAAQGAGALRAARTRNAGAADAAIGESTRIAGQQLSDAGIKTRLANAAMKQKQQSEGVTGIERLFAENLSGGNQALGIVPNAVNADTNAENASWDWAKDLFTPIMSAAMGNSANVVKAFKGGQGGG